MSTPTTTAPSSGAQDPAPPPAGGRRRRRWGVYAVLGGLLALVAWGVVVVLALSSAGGALLDGRRAVEDGRAQLLAAEPGAARAALAEGAAAFAEARDELDRPAVRVLRVVPGLGRNLSAVTAIAEAGGYAAEAGVEVAGGLEELPGGVSALAPSGGAVPVDSIAALGQPAVAARDLMAQADAAITRAPRDGLIGPVADARAELADLVGQARDTADAAAALTEALPAFLGADEPRRYLFGAQNPAELRGTGGLMGAYAILTVDQGRLDFSSFGPIQDLPNAGPDEVEAPSTDFAARYHGFGGTGNWLNLNFTPDFPSAATAILRLYQHTTGDALDGVIVADPFALEALLRVSDPAGAPEAPGVGRLSADNVVAVVTNEAYAALTDPEARKRVLGDVAAGVLTAFLDSGPEVDATETVSALGDAVGGGHLLFHAADAHVQEALEAAGATGELRTAEGDYLAVVANNLAAHKADFYADREVSYEVALGADGDATSRATVRLSNGAPTDGMPSYVIGPNVEGLEPGDNRTLLSVYAGPQVEVEGFRRSRFGDAVVESELGHPVITSQIDLASGEEETLQYEFNVERAWSIWNDEDATPTYRLTVQGQPTVRATAFELLVRPPPGMAFSGTAAEGFETADDGAVRWRGELSRLLELELALEPTEPQARGWRRAAEVLRRPVWRLGATE